MTQLATIIRPSDEQIKKYSGKGIDEMKDNPAPKSEEILGNGVLVKGSKACIYANPKVGKSVFGTQGGLCIASGTPFIGIPVIHPCNVFYLNFEVDTYMMEQRILDIEKKLNLPHVSRFRNLTLLGEDIPQLDTDRGVSQLAQILEVQNAIGSPVELMILDCRYKTVQKSENQDDVLKPWVRNLDELIKLYQFTLLVIHHNGKNTKGVGSGSNVFDRWINTSFELKPYKWESALSPSKERKVIIGGNYTSGLEIPVVLDFPIHTPGGDDVWKKPLSQTDLAKNSILEILTGGTMEQTELEAKMKEKGHKRWAFFQAMSELEDEGFIIPTQDPTKPGNHNLIKPAFLPSAG